MPQTVVRLVGLAPWLLFAAWLVGELVGDRGRVSGWLFYLPALGVAAFLLAWGLLAGVRGGRLRRRGLALLVAALAPAWVAVAVDNHWRAPATPAGATPAGERIRVAHWNVFRGGLGWSGPRDRLRAAGADVVALSESPSGVPFADLARDLGPGFVARGAGSLVVLCGAAAGSSPRLVAAHEAPGRYEWLVVDCPRAVGASRVLVADVDADPLQARAAPIAAIRAAIVHHRPDLVVGDFNTPRRSRHLTPPPPGYRHCYDTAGRGGSYTWPVPFPMLAIDQCLHGERVTPSSYALDSTRWSDHRLQVLDAVLRHR